MKILIAVASRHGSTLEIAEAIARALRAAGQTVDVRDVGLVTGGAGYDAAIVGSAVYMGNWLAEARNFIERNSGWLTGIPVWLFSSGPLGEEASQKQADPLHLDELMRATHAREHHVFVGKLDKASTNVGERLVIRMVHAPYGDFRDWEEIRDWASAIAQALPQATTPTA